MGKDTSAARPYAIAAYETAVAFNAVDKWAEALACLADTVQQEAVWQLITNPNYASSVLAEVCIDLAKGTLSNEQANFVRLLANVDKLVLLPEIKVLFNYLKAAINETIDVTVSSVQPLSDDNKAKLTTALKTRLQREPNITYQEDAHLLGGLLIHAGDTVIDGTVKTQLQRFTEVLKGEVCN